MVTILEVYGRNIDTFYVVTNDDGVSEVYDSTLSRPDTINILRLCGHTVTTGRVSYSQYLRQSRKKG